ncbi:MAG: T9SS type A sorting domain-containing protein [Bacteriovoracaceae bacterium]|nr:T9SS type A sorting domain-containing protein [Bacteroidota bacterium]
MKTIVSLLNRILFVIVFCTAIGIAGGPSATVNGVAVRYNNASAITYKTDLGNMGSFSNTVATNLVSTSFSTWQNVSTAQITFTNGGQLVSDVTGANYTNFVDKFDDNINPMIFDTDGSIIDAMLGVNASNSTIGFAGSSYFISGPNVGKYSEGQAVMNGKFANNPFTEAQFKATFVHEFGHFIGLDHSQINMPFVGDGNQANDAYIPTMYPTSTDDDTHLATLNPDDIAAVSMLYPKSTFATTTGMISGTVTRFDNSVVRGANVVAKSTGADSLTNQISTVTDYYTKNTGAYTIIGLAPGNYYVRIEPVKSSFIKGSSVGPYANSATDLSFINPVVTEYYNAGAESSDPATDNPGAKTSVAVAANATTANINLIANKVPNAPITNILEYHTGLNGVFELPSNYGDKRYSVRFTPGANAKFIRTEYYINSGVEAIEGTGSLKVSLHQNTTGSLGGVPGTQIGSPISIPFTQIAKSGYNLVDFSSQNLQVQANVDFHIAFEVVGVAGDTLQFVSDNASTPTNRSSSYFNGPGGLKWYNLLEPDNYSEGYNFAVRAVIDIPATVKKSELLPAEFTLQQNYPNPFNPATTIGFSVPRDGFVMLKVYSLLGEEVATLVNENLTTGEYTAQFDATKLASGMYVVTATTGNSSLTKKILLLK